MSPKDDLPARAGRRKTARSVRLGRRDSSKIGSILVPLDFSRTSIKALKYALPLSERFGAELHLAYALDYDYAMSTLSVMPLAIPEADLACRAKRRLEDTAQKHGSVLAAENCHVAKGRPYHAICELARKLKTDLIVTATHGHTGLRHVFLGSTAERIVQHAPCGVLVVREHERDFVRASEGGANSSGVLQLQKILVPVDFSDCSTVGLESAVRFAQLWNAQLVAFNCVPLQTFAIYAEYAGLDRIALANNAQQTAAKQLHGIVSRLETRDISVKGVAELGLPAQAICDYARNHEVDLIVIATHGSTGLNHVLLGSTAEHVVRHAHCPVLVVPSWRRGGKHAKL